ncbi:MAG: GNAT family N-acetyltransferase [Anaerolineales bacterium]|nr:GNAT family N-acetyltransferase [Anaerolineales bacterium]MCZ2123648.1 GNAT family N-acetyltransferase [Anaerolineales bacterium]
METIETERLVIRKFSPADAPFILELLNEPSFIKNIGDRNVRNLADAEKYILDGPTASYAKNGFGLCLVTLKATGVSMGMCGLIKREALENVDVGYAFLPRFWSKGYANEAVNATLNYGWQVAKLNRIVAITDPKNTASNRVLEKLGFAFEKMIKLKADDIDLKLYAIHKP